MEMTDQQRKLIKRLENPLVFRWFTRRMVPAAAHAGVKLVTFSGQECKTRIPFRNRNKNPFRSMYFAVQSMAAEMSTALPAMFHIEGHSESIAWIVIDFSAEFPSKATSDVTFHCTMGREIAETIALCVKTGESQTIVVKTTGTMDDGTVVSRFGFHWSFRVRKSTVSG